MKPFILLSMMLACLAQGVTSWAVEMTAKWAFEPLREVAVPVGEGHTIDGFVRQRLAKAGLAQNGTATPGALVRRLHLNLIGLPPEPEVIRSFEQNPTGEAYLKLVDELLASPLYGERWARHWLDVARYGQVLRPRKLVNVRGAGPHSDGTYYVQSVSTQIQRGSFKQSFTLSRNAHGSFSEKVAV